jgi:sarcosine oxidase delta subunit
MGRNLKRSVRDTWKDEGWSGERNKRMFEAKREAKALKNEDLADFSKNDWDDIVKQENRF